SRTLTRFRFTTPRPVFIIETVSRVTPEVAPNPTFPRTTFSGVLQHASPPARFCLRLSYRLLDPSAGAAETVTVANAAGNVTTYDFNSGGDLIKVTTPTLT